MSQVGFRYFYRNILILWYNVDGIVHMSPVTKRALSKTVEALRQAGHECEEFVLPDGTTYDSSANNI